MIIQKTAVYAAVFLMSIESYFMHAFYEMICFVDDGLFILVAFRALDAVGCHTGGIGSLNALKRVLDDHRFFGFNSEGFCDFKEKIRSRFASFCFIREKGNMTLRMPWTTLPYSICNSVLHGCQVILFPAFSAAHRIWHPYT